MITYSGYMLVVKDMAISRRFYADLLGQKLKVDTPEYVVFEGEFSLFLEHNFRPILASETERPIHLRAHNGELYFESDDIETDESRLMQNGVEFIHTLTEQPWGQRVMRFYDPDGAVIEVGEKMGKVIKRFLNQGMSIVEVAQRIGFSETMVRDLLEEN